MISIALLWGTSALVGASSAPRPSLSSAPRGAPAEHSSLLAAVGARSSIVGLGASRHVARRRRRRRLAARALMFGASILKEDRRRMCLSGSWR